MLEKKYSDKYFLCNIYKSTINLKIVKKTRGFDMNKVFHDIFKSYLFSFGYQTNLYGGEDGLLGS